MRIVIPTVGSRGDIQPYVALGRGLQQAGYAVALAAPPTFASFIADYGLGFHPVNFNPQEFANDPAVRAALRTRNIARIFRLFKEVLAPRLAGMFADLWAASGAADALVIWPAAHGAYECAEARSLPVVMAALQPLVNPTAAFPSFALPPGVGIGGHVNRLTYVITELALWQTVRQPLAAWRRRLGLKPLPGLGPFAHMRSRGTPWVLGYSPTLLPRPHDWPANHQPTGYWFLPAQETWQPSPQLQSFLAAGPPPVSIGFGSMPVSDAQKVAQMAVAALEQAGQRGILLAGWTGLGGIPLPDTVLALESAPHDWLFPRMAAVVHHGGAGTTAAGLRAGVPAVIVPFGLDQFAWGDMIARLGIGPRPIPARKLTTALLARSIQEAAGNRSMQAQAALIGRVIRAEDGVGTAVRLIDQALAA